MYKKFLDSELRVNCEIVEGLEWHINEKHIVINGVTPAALGNKVLLSYTHECVRFFGVRPTNFIYFRPLYNPEHCNLVLKSLIDDINIETGQSEENELYYTIIRDEDGKELLKEEDWRLKTQSIIMALFRYFEGSSGESYSKIVNDIIENDEAFAMMKDSRKNNKK